MPPPEGKAGSLIALRTAGFNVPALVVIGTEIFAAFLGDRQTEFHRVSQSGKAASLQALIDEQQFTPALLRQIETVANPLFREGPIAVRSTAADEDGNRNSFAGIHETCLNVAPDGLSAALKTVWRSYFSEHAFAYRAERSVGIPISASLFLQRMVAPDVAGVCFTVNPATGRPDEMLIEAVWGLGAPLVSGDITPDTIVVGRKEDGFEIRDYFATPQDMQLTAAGMVAVPVDRQEIRKLDTGQLLQIVDICTQIETARGAPQDIEWALVKDELFILQARPITTL